MNPNQENETVSNQVVSKNILVNIFFQINFLEVK